MYPTPAQQALYRSIQHRTSLTMDEFLEGVCRFDLTPIEDAGEVIGAVMIDTNEIHIGMWRTPRTCQRSAIRRTLAALVARYGSARTAVKKDNQRGVAFCRRLGFKEVRRDEDGVYMECREVRHA